MVDNIPIRTYKNHADKGVAFPRWQPMGIKISLWNGDSWATRGGKDKIDWSKGPFIASFRNYKIDACIWKGNARFCRADSTTNWWNKARFRSLTSKQRRWFKWVRQNHLIYDYCKDKQRFQNDLPKECSLPKYWLYFTRSISTSVCRSVFIYLFIFHFFLWTSVVYVFIY